VVYICIVFVIIIDGADGFFVFIVGIPRITIASKKMARSSLRRPGNTLPGRLILIVRIDRSISQHAHGNRNTFRWGLIPETSVANHVWGHS
jgi:hypothetical protein